MMKRIAEASPRFKARIAGVLSLLGLLAGIFGEFFVRRLEFAGGLLAVSGMIAVTLLLYDIFKPVNRGLSLLVASFNLVGLTFGALRWNPRGVRESVLALSTRSLRPGFRTVRGLASNLCSIEHVFGRITNGTTSTGSSPSKRKTKEPL